MPARRESSASPSPRRPTSFAYARLLRKLQNLNGDVQYYRLEWGAMEKPYLGAVEPQYQRGSGSRSHQTREEEILETSRKADPPVPMRPGVPNPTSFSCRRTSRPHGTPTVLEGDKSKKAGGDADKDRVCYYCQKVGHRKADCK